MYIILKSELSIKGVCKKVIKFDRNKTRTSDIFLISWKFLAIDKYMINKLSNHG